MAFQVNFYNYSKRDNSTAIPSGTPETVSCVLKDGTSILSPTLMLEYASIPAWSHFSMLGRYYKISDIRSIRNNIIEVDGRVDVLASWKAEILASSAFVAYDTTANTEIADRRLSAKTTPEYAVTTSGNFEYIGRGACVALDIVGETGSATYLLGVDEAATILNGISSSQWLSDNFKSIVWDDSMPTDEAIVDVVTQLGQNVVNAIRELIATGAAPSMLRGARLMCFPVSAGNGPEVQNIKLGSYPSGVTGYRQNQIARTSEIVSATIPWTFSDWRRNSPYTQLYVYSPYFGLVNLPTSDLIGKGQIDCSVSFSPISGDALFMLSAVPAGGGPSIKLGQYSANLSSPHLIGSSNVSAWNQVMAATSGSMAVGSALALGPIGAAIGTRGIMGALDHVQPIPSTIGTAGGSALLALGLPPPLTVIEITHDTTVQPNSVSAVIGTPADAVKSLAGLSGYVECRNASVSGAMTDAERTEINQYLNGGVYIE